MAFPELQLTKYESERIGKYADPRTGKRGVLRHFYPGFLELTPTMRLPTYSFQIARRCRVFAITFAGDTDYIRLALTDVTGEKHTQQDLFASMLSPGSCRTPYSSFVNPAASSRAPHIFPYIIEPNIVLAPNQTLQMTGYEAVPSDGENSYRVDFVLHVWEFPGVDGSPQ